MQTNFSKGPLFISISLIILSCIAFLFLYKQITKNNNFAQAAESEWQTEAIHREELRTFNESIKLVENDITKLDTHFSKSSDVVPFLDTIEKLALDSKTQSEVSSVNVLPLGNGLLVNIKSKGTFSNIYKFLMLLENSPYELQITSFDVTKSVEQDLLDIGTKKTSGPSTWTAIFRIQLLSFVQ